jgi:SpoVK/Ycf46/Vps4 family AAA+-type ATPase
LEEEYPDLDNIPENARKTLTGQDIPSEYLQQYYKPSQESKDDAMKKLKELIGLRRVKEKIEELKINIAFEGKTEPGHYIFAGSPGTGKTTVARLLGDILREEGVLKRGHVIDVKREDLVVGYVGQTAPKTKEKLTEALDGILFIDEAYTLVEGGQNDFGKEAINTILAFMEDNRHRICVICAGYTKDMERFVEGNRGLKSRFTEIIHFDDYDVNELVQILLSFGIGYTMEQDFIQKSKEIFEIWINNKGDDFGNARDVRNYFNECKTTQRKRLITEYGNADNIPEGIKITLTGQDIPSKYLHIAGDLANELVSTNNLNKMEI